MSRSSDDAMALWPPPTASLADVSPYPPLERWTEGSWSFEFDDKRDGAFRFVGQLAQPVQEGPTGPFRFDGLSTETPHVMHRSAMSALAPGDSGVSALSVRECRVRKPEDRSKLPCHRHPGTGMIPSQVARSCPKAGPPPARIAGGGVTSATGLRASRPDAAEPNAQVPRATRGGQSRRLVP